MSSRAVKWHWRYTMQYASARPKPDPPATKHAVPEGATVSLCNRSPYWRLPEQFRRWMGATPEEADLLPVLKQCQACTTKIKVLEETTR